MSALVSSSRRPLPLTMRADLEVRKQAYQGREYFVIKDPLGLKYYRFEAEEYSLLTMLDGQISLDQLRQKFDQQFAPQTITIGELHQLLGLLYRNGLLISDAPGQGVQLLARDNERWWQRMKGGLGNILTIRFRGVDPDRWLTWLNGHLGWLFSPAAGMLVGLLVLAALLLISAEFEVFRARLPGFREFFAVQNWLALAVTLTITKILHEFVSCPSPLESWVRPNIYSKTLIMLHTEKPSSIRFAKHLLKAHLNDADNHDKGSVAGSLHHAYIQLKAMMINSSEEDVKKENVIAIEYK